MVAGPVDPAARPGIRSFRSGDYDADRLRRGKGDRTVSVCIPARNEEPTIAPIVTVLRREVVDAGLADELIVIDDHSDDATGARAAAAGATVVHAGDVLPEHGAGHGKGEVLWKSLHVSTGEIVVWCDADIQHFDRRFVTGVLGPLLCEPDVELVKGHYRRPESNGTGGGRVTELVARPLLSLLFPELADLHQPLSGEYGGVRGVLERLPFVQGYGVEIGLLIDYLRLRGTAGLAQVDLEVRWHRNRTLDELGPQALAVTQTILRYADPQLVPAVADLLRPGLPPARVDVSVRPPMRDVERATSASA